MISIGEMLLNEVCFSNFLAFCPKIAIFRIQEIDLQGEQLNNEKIEIIVNEPRKMGDGINAYVAFKITTRVGVNSLDGRFDLILHR